MPFIGVDLISLVENVAEGIIVADSKGIIRLANPSACRMFDYSDQELSGSSIEMLIPMHMRSAHEKHRDSFQAKPVNRVMGQGRDLKARKKSGDEFPVEISLSTYLQEGERFVIAFVIDISSRKEIEENMIRQQKQLEKVTSEMRKLNAELEAKVEERTMILKEALQKLEQSQEELSEALDKEKQLNEIKSRFVSMASHEFRTPLSTVLSSATLISKYVQSEDQSKRDRHIEKIIESVKHLNSLLEDFLSLGKLDEGKISAKKDRFNLKKLVSETLYEMTAQLKEGQQVNYVHQGEEEIRNDKLLFKNILINLLSNAMKFSDPGKTISIRCTIEADTIEISVEDQGIGISLEDQEHLFSTFFRAKNAFNIQGTGLGLHIIKRYIDLLEGTIQLESELDKGTKVTFIVPNKTLSI
jgi:PAS domain S-box-containing protein